MKKFRPLIKIGVLVTAAYLLVQCNPFCTYTSWTEVEAEISVNGQTYMSSVIHKASRSRRWISTINYNGCKQDFGETFIFRLSNNRVILMRVPICDNAENRLTLLGSSDITNACENKRRRSPDFLVDSATSPKYWRELTPRDGVKLVKVTAKRTRKSPRDDVDDVAPALLDATFKKGAISWAASPEPLIPFMRRYEKDIPFKYTVIQGEFPL